MKFTFFMLLLLMLMEIPLLNGQEEELTKCCKPEERFKPIKNEPGIFKCKPREFGGIDNNFENFGFISKNLTGKCIDLYTPTKIGIFTIDNNKTITKAENAYNFLPKCCRLGYKYNRTFHGCAEVNKSDELKIFNRKNAFFNIGLSKCKIVSDEVLERFEFNKTGLFIEEKEEHIPKGEYCIDSTLDGKFVVRRCEQSEICKRKTCIRKCCDDGKAYYGAKHECILNSGGGVDLNAIGVVENPKVSENFVIVHGEVGSFKEIKIEFPELKFQFDEEGKLKVTGENTSVERTYELEDEKYCIETFIYPFSNTMYFTGSPDKPVKDEITKWMKVLSCICLFLTTLVYMILPRMRNLFGKMLLCYNVATFVFFQIQTAYQLYGPPVHKGVECKVMGYLTLLACIWSFSWLQILCLDIWFSFGKSKTSINLFGNRVKKLFIQYCLYGWGLPLAWVLFIFLFSETAVLPGWIHPYVGEKNCFLEKQDDRPGNYGHLMFLVLPLLIQQIINIVLFIRTIRHCWKIKAEIRRMNDGRGQNFLTASRERMGFVLKLSIIMGVPLVFQFISVLYNFEKAEVTAYIEIGMDCVSSLQGVFIFIIFVCKKKVYDSILKKCSFTYCTKAEEVPSRNTMLSMHIVEDSREPNK